MTGRPRSTRLVTPWSRMPQGTIPSKWPRSGSTLIEMPWKLTQFLSRTPIAAILSSRGVPSGLQTPWAIVTSEIGRVRIGGRTRVIDIDWSDSVVKADAPTLFPDVTDTKGGPGGKFIHVYGNADATKILRRLAESCS